MTRGMAAAGRGSSVDPIVLELIAEGLISNVREMRTVVIRTAGK